MEYLCLNTMPMNLQQLEYIIALDKYKHFGKAAQSCFITQPTLSAMIQKIEDELSVKIFDRTTHPVRTTDSGQHIIKKAQKVLESVNDLRETANHLNSIIGGKITLGIIPTVSPYLLSHQVFRFLNHNDQVEMTLKELSTEQIIKALKNGEIDAGIIATPYQGSEEFYSETLFPEELMLYSSEQRKDTFVMPEEVDVEKIWLLEEGNCLRTQFEYICHLKESTQKPRNLQFAASSIATLVQLVDQMGGITILPELAAGQLSEAQRRKLYRFRKPFPYRDITLIYYKPTYKQKIIDGLTAYIKESLSGQLNYDKSPADFIKISAR